MGIKSSKSKTKPIYSKQIEGAANTVQGVYDANSQGIANMSSNLQGRIPGLLERAFGQNENLDASEGYARRVVNGEFLNNNPYVDEMARISRDNAGDSVNSYFGRMGRVGGGAHMEDLGRGMSEAELGTRAGIYGNERNMQQQAAFAMPSLTEARYQGIPYALQATGAAAEIPFTGSRNLASGIGGLLGQYTRTSQTPSLLSSIGNAASVGGQLAGLFSDPRLKTNVEKVGQLDDGLGIYEYNYNVDWLPQERQRGVMADEVATLRPWALGPVVDGYATVNYGAL